MKIKLLFFAGMQEEIGCNELEWDLHGEAVKDLLIRA